MGLRRKGPRKPEIVIGIPSYNEAENIGTLTQILEKSTDVIYSIKQEASLHETTSTSISPLFDQPKIDQLQIDIAIKRANLRTSYTFEKFAVSGSNQLAHAAAEAVVAMSSGSTATFSVSGASHSAVIKSITETSVILTISSTPIDVELTIGETKEVDVDTDGKNDLSVTLDSITSGVANLKFKSLAVVATTEPSTPTTPTTETGTSLTSPSNEILVPDTFHCEPL